MTQTARSIDSTNYDAVLDSDALREARAVMKERFPSMIAYYLEDMEDYINRIERAAAENNAEAMAPAAHTAKSSSRQMGAIRVSNIAKSIEFIARNAVTHQASLSEVPGLLKQLKEAFALTREAFGNTI